MTEPAALPVPVYSIFDRDIPLAHIHACIIVNPIGPTEDKREACEKTVNSCEGRQCVLKSEADGAPAKASRHV